jgi:ABC-2 type transport system ATP-binding protein
MVDVEHVTFAYRKREPLFRDLSMGLTDGNIYGLLGKNGAGKTTLLKLMTGLLFPDAGETRIEGLPATKRAPAALQEIFFIPEEFHTPDISGRRYVELYGGFYPRFDREAMEHYAREFELDLTKRLGTMSYGQRKKFLVAFGFATMCRILILDEPTNGLDIPSKSQFRRLAASAMSDDRTFIVSTHQVRDMENLIDPVIIIDEGRILFQESMEAVTSKLRVDVVSTENEAHGALYSEKVPGGYAAVRKNDSGAESRIDLELLFNVVTSNKERVSAIFAETEESK